MSPPHIVGIRFHKLGKVYHFDASRLRDLTTGDFAVVQTQRGKQLGQVVHIPTKITRPKKGRWKPVERKATPRDLVLRQVWQKKELEVTIACRAKAAELGLKEIKIVTSEFSFDGKNLMIIYNYAGDKKQDLSKLQQFVKTEFEQKKVEMRTVGPRDVAKIIGGMGACGQEARCCSMFLTEFSPISIKMAKAQGVSLNPTEITGICGRLRCCLIYEYEQYVKARKTLPKRNKKVVTPLGEGKVIDLLPLKQAVIVYIPDKGRYEFLNHEIEPWNELEALRRKAEQPCERHGDGKCDCKKSSSGNS